MRLRNLDAGDLGLVLSKRLIVLNSQRAADHADRMERIEAQRMLYKKITPQHTFREAFDIWITRRTVSAEPKSGRVRYIAPKTEKDYRTCFRALEKYFIGLKLEEIDPGHMMVYQNARAECDLTIAAWAAPAGANCIRKEIALLQRLLREAGLWGEEQKEAFIRVQAEDLDVARALTAEEQEHFLHIASGRQDFHFLYCYALLTLDSTCSAGEMRGLRLGDISIEDRIIMVRKASAKNKYRIRTIALNTDEGAWALGELVKRAAELGARSPQHYLFPIKEGFETYDPTRPMSEQGLKQRFNAVAEAANLQWFKPNGFRHTGLTRLAEGGMSIHGIMVRAGHIKPRTQEHYVQIGLAAQRKMARAALFPDRAAGVKVGQKKPPARQEPPAPKGAEMRRGIGPFWVSSTYGF